MRTSASDTSVLKWLVAAAFVVILNETIMMNAIPRLMVDLDIDETAAQWLSTAFMLTMAVVIPNTPIDWPSAALAAVGFGALVYGLSQISRPTPVVVSLAVAGVLGVAAFVWRQLVLQRSDKPLLDLRTFQSRVFTVSLAAMSIAFGAMIGSMLLLQLYLQQARHATPLATGLLVMPGGLAMGLLGPTIGRIYDRHGARVLMVPGGVLAVLGLAGFTLMDATTPYWMILIAHVALSLGLASMFTPMFTVSLGSLPAKQYPHGSSLLGTSQQVAGALGTALAVVVLTSRAAASAQRGLAEAAAYLDGLRWAFGLCTVLAVGILALVATLPARVSSDQHELVDVHV